MCVSGEKGGVFFSPVLDHAPDHGSVGDDTLVGINTVTTRGGPPPCMCAMASEDATKRLSSKKQTLDDAYAAPANFLEIDVINPITHGVANKRYTDYEVRMKVRRS